MTNNQCNRQCSLLHIRGRGECQVLALFDQQFSLSLSLALCMLHLHSNRPRFAVSNPTVGCLRAQLSVTQAPAASSDMHRQAHSSQLFVVARPPPHEAGKQPKSAAKAKSISHSAAGSCSQWDLCRCAKSDGWISDFGEMPPPFQPTSHFHFHFIPMQQPQKGSLRDGAWEGL